MSNILIISASPSPSSKTRRMADFVASELTELGHTTEHLLLRELPPDAMLAGNAKDPAIARAIDKFDAAQGIVIATPIYKAAYSGLLKVFLDLLPQFGLRKKVVLPIATGGSMAHVLALDYALRPVLQSMSAHHIVQGQYMLESWMRVENDALVIDEPGRTQLIEIVVQFELALELSRAMAAIDGTA